jgi:hypothetical protein
VFGVEPTGRRSLVTRDSDQRFRPPTRAAARTGEEHASKRDLASVLSPPHHPMESISQVSRSRHQQHGSRGQVDMAEVAGVATAGVVEAEA